MRPAGRRGIMKVALMVRKVGQHCAKRSAKKTYLAELLSTDLSRR